jgi:hypothetical protein
MVSPYKERVRGPGRGLSDPGSLLVKWIRGKWRLRRRRVARWSDPWARRHRVARWAMAFAAVAMWAALILLVVRLVAVSL